MQQMGMMGMLERMSGGMMPPGSMGGFPGGGHFPNPGMLPPGMMSSWMGGLPGQMMPGMWGGMGPGGVMQGMKQGQVRHGNARLSRCRLLATLAFDWMLLQRELLDEHVCVEFVLNVACLRFLLTSLYATHLIFTMFNKAYLPLRSVTSCLFVVTFTLVV